MGWLWMCLGIRGKSARRIGGRVSSDTYLAPQFDPTKTPRIEDFLQPRNFVNGHPPASPTPNGNCKNDVFSGAEGTRKFHGGHGGAESIKAEYGPYWGYSEDLPGGEDFLSIEFPRVTPAARKSFSELLMETDTLDKGPLALAAMAAAAERAARLKLQKDGANAFPGFQVKEVHIAEDNRNATLKDDNSAAVESPAASMKSSLSKDHLEALNAVAAFKESRRKSQVSEKSSSVRPTEANPSYISSLFRSSRKRSLPFRSRSFQRPLSPVPEVLALDEASRSRRRSDATRGDAISSTVMESFSCEMETSILVQPSLLIPSSGKEQRHEDWDDYVLVERIQETPTSIQKDDNPCENQGRDGAQDGRSLDEDPATSSVDGRILDEDANSKAALQDDATSKATTSTCAVCPSPGVNSPLGSDDSQLLRTPVRDPMVTPEVFISPKTTSAEYNFQRVNDMDPEERPIFGSLADHWEAAWATKRPVWDGRGILNDTNKYREDQKVMWHAVPFEERLAQALATQEDPVLQRRNSFKSPTSRLSASRSIRSLQAH